MQNEGNATIAFAGRRIDAPGARVARFPLKNVPVVTKRIQDALEAARASTLVCSAAAGADLLALTVAGQLGLGCHILLPFAIERFRVTSVIDRPDERWGALFDREIR